MASMPQHNAVFKLITTKSAQVGSRGTEADPEDQDPEPVTGGETAGDPEGAETEAGQIRASEARRSPRPSSPREGGRILQILKQILLWSK